MYYRILCVITTVLVILGVYVAPVDVYGASPASDDNDARPATSAQAAPPIVINEVHYNPADNLQKIEFIELYNPTAAAVDLSGWILTDAVEYTFAAGAQIGAAQYLIVADDPASMQSLLGVTALGPWDGSLSGDGERIELRDASANLIDDVNYDIDFPWPVAAGGEGASMELLHPELDNDLGSSWRSSPNNAASPGQPNGAYLSSASAAPPNVRQVAHLPEQPAANAPTVISAKVTDLDGVASVQFQYQVVSPGNYIPAYLAKPTADLLANPLAARAANPAYSNNWVLIPMLDNGASGDSVANDDTYTVVLPGQVNRTLVRYRIRITDTQGASALVPYADDPSLNFAYFVYDGVPAYVASSQSLYGSVPYTHNAVTMNSLPVYTLLTSQPDFDRAVAFDGADQILRGNNDARSAFNWSGTFVYKGKVYDNMRYRLRQRNARYKPPNGKRSFRFRFNRGSYIQLHDLEGNAYPTKWRTLNTHKMWALGGSTYGINEIMNNQIWETFGVPAPATHWSHFRVVTGADEVPSGGNSQYEGDFYGLLLALEDYDARFLEARDLEKGNLYKLKSDVHDGKAVQRYQAADGVSDASDFDNILWALRPERDDAWIDKYVDFAHWSRYSAVVEAVRHYDVAPNTNEHLKNRVWYFAPSVDSPLGVMRTLPWDADTSWGPNYNRGIDFVKYSIFGYDGAAPRETFLVGYRNTVRELRDLIWQEDQIHAQLEHAANGVGPIMQADLDRWRGAPGDAYSAESGDLFDKIQDMKNFAFVGGSWIGGSRVIHSYDTGSGSPASDDGISGQQGRDAYLDWLAADSKIPNTPSVTYSGGTGYPIDQLTFQSSAFSDPQGGNTFAGMEWRLAEITEPNAPTYDPAAPPLWEYDAVWLSGELTSFDNSITVPAGLAMPGHAYRARVRMKDNSGRWSHWSMPVEFIAGCTG